MPDSILVHVDEATKKTMEAIQQQVQSGVSSAVFALQVGVEDNLREVKETVSKLSKETGDNRLEIIKLLQTTERRVADASNALGETLAIRLGEEFQNIYRLLLSREDALQQQVQNGVSVSIMGLQAGLADNFCEVKAAVSQLSEEGSNARAELKSLLQETEIRLLELLNSFGSKLCNQLNENTESLSAVLSAIERIENIENYFATIKGKIDGLEAKIEKTAVELQLSDTYNLNETMKSLDNLLVELKYMQTPWYKKVFRKGDMKK